MKCQKWFVAVVLCAAILIPAQATDTVSASKEAPSEQVTSSRALAVAPAVTSALPAGSTGPATPTPSAPTGISAQANQAGAFTYSYRLNLPPGTNGVQPNLSLTYNSAAPNGILGMGFSLTGLSAIERDASRGINFSASDSYILDGQKLYLDTPETADKFFSPERESFDRIQAFLTTAPTTPVSNPNNANAYWVVSKKDGTQLFYGDYPGRATSATDKSTVPALGQTTPRQWALSKVMDANGNFYTISYLYDAATGAHYPLKIVYTLGNGLTTTKTVQFSYEARTDHGPMYLPTKIDLDKRLKWITVLLGTNETGTGGTLVRKYRVDYQYSASTGRTQATAIQEYGKDGNITAAGVQGTFVGTGTTLPAVELGWEQLGSGGFALTNGAFSWDWNSGTTMISPGDSFRATDVNGDGKADIIGLSASNGKMYVALSGSGFSATNGSYSWNWNSGTTMISPGDSFQATDVNGDGKADIIGLSASNGKIYVALSGSGFSTTNGSYSWDWNSGTTMISPGDSFQATDVNGDGKADIIALSASNGKMYASFSGYSPDLLTTITVPTGGTITASYTAAPQNPSEPGVSGPIQPSLSVYPKVANASTRPLVTRIVLDPKLPGMQPVTTTYEYFNGQYLSGTSEVRADLGFERVTQIDAAGTKTITTFSQDAPTQGMPISTLVQGSDGKKYVESKTTYRNSPVTGAHAKVRFVSTTDQVTMRFDGKTTSTDTKRSMEYDSAGNLTKLTNHGILNVAGNEPVDDVREEYSYALSNTKYLYRMTKKRTFSFDDAPTPTEALASEASYYYDGSATLGTIGLGRLTKGENRINATTTASSTIEYDTWGNLTKTTDASGVVTSQVTYDSVYHNLVTTTTDVRGLTTSVTAWDNLMPAAVQDHQNNVSRVVYDLFGRKVKTISPLPRDTPESPTTETISTNTAPPVGTPVVIETKEKTTGTTYLPTFTYLDGLGRVVQTKTLARVGGQWVTVDRYYDTLGRNVAVSNPYLSAGSAFSYDASLFSNLSQRKTTFTFDALGRVIQTSRPIDTSNTLAVTRTLYDQTKTISVDPLNHVTEVEDRGNVHYQRTYTGTYPNQLLYTTVKVTNSRGKTVVEDDKDNNQSTPGNKITTLYDMLGRKTQYIDPDMGTWAYTYTANGSLLTQTDAKGNVMSFTYDSAGRVETKKQGATTVATYTFGTTGYQRGLLEKVYLGSATGTPYQQYTYDQFGRTTDVSKTIGTYGTKAISLAYNADGRLASKSFPGGAETVSFIYSPEGLLRTMDGTNTYLSSTSVDDFGRTFQKSWGNGTTTTYTIDPVTFRTSDIVTPGVMNLHYDFNSDGNVWKKTEASNTSANEVFTYDDLGRLKTATGLYGSRTYLYDPTGNLLGQNGAAVNTYTGTGPHAISGDGTHTYTYDTNGNLTTRKLGATTDGSYSYDAENRLTSATVGAVTSTYTYDDTRQRTTLTVGTKTTVFWFDDFEETFTSGASTETVRSYSADGQKVAQRSSVTGLVFVYTDHLGSTSKVRDSTTGTVTASYYEPFGKLYSTTINGVRESFTGQDWDGSAQLMYYNARFYDPALGRFIQTDPAVADMQYSTKLSLMERMNPYIYCVDNPVNFTDPSGMWTWGFGIVIGFNGGNWSVGFGIAADVSDSTKEKTQGLNISTTVGGNGWVSTAGVGFTDVHGDYQGLGTTTVINAQGLASNSNLDFGDLHASAFVYVTGDEVSAGFDSDLGGVSLVGLSAGWQRDSGMYVDAYAIPALGGLSYYADSHGNSQLGGLWMVANWGKFGPESGALADYTYGNRVGAKRQSGDPIDLVDAIALEHDKGMSWNSNMRAAGAARNLLQNNHRHLTPYQRVAARNLLLLRTLAPYAAYVDSQNH